MKNQDNYLHFISLIKGFNVAMLVSRGLTGNLVARPMAIAGFDASDDSLYFFSSIDTEKVQEISDDPHVVLTFSDTWKMASLSGEAGITKNDRKIQQFWKDKYKVWFAEGLDDPSLCLIRVEPVEGEYWDYSGTEAIKYLYKTAKALVTGTTQEFSTDKQHGQVRF